MSFFAHIEKALSIPRQNMLFDIVQRGFAQSHL